MDEECMKKYIDEFGNYFFKINRFANRIMGHQDISRQQYMLMQLLSPLTEEEIQTFLELNRKMASHLG